MDSKKRRSTLRKSISSDVDNMKTQLKRRISFSGKNSVRVFHGEEEPKTWNNSYEISDHLNGNETASNLGAPAINKIPRSALKNKHNNKENFAQSNTTQQDLQMENKNMSVNTNQSILSTTKDLINISYQHQNSKMYHIENSIDITLYEREIQFQNGQNKTGEQTANNLCSFSLDDNEKEARSIMFGERTVDFMRELKGDSSNIRDDIKTNDFKDDKCVTVFSEYMEEDQYFDITCTKGKSLKEPITIYMNDSLSISGNEDTAKNSRRTIQQATAMILSPNMAKQYDKENVNPTSLTNVNETQNETCEMEINDDIFLPTQTNEVNVQKETIAFQEKLNRLSFLQESDDNMNIENSLEGRIAEPNIKARSTINYNEAIEMSPKDSLVKSKINSRSTINCNQPIEISPQNKGESSKITAAIKKGNHRKSINFNKTIDFSPRNVEVKSGDDFVLKDKSRQTLNFNQSIELDIKNVLVGECNNQQGTIPKEKFRPTINFHQPIETSPPKVNSNFPRQTINLNEDISDSPAKLTQEPVSNNNNSNLNVPGSIRKHGQLPKLVVRKICTPLVNKNKNPIDLEQQRMLRYKKKQEQDLASGNVKNMAAAGIEHGNPSKAEKSLNFSLTSVKNMSLSPESSSPLIPSEFKALNFKQLNDELERGKINLFPNAPKTPSTDRKNRNIASNFTSKHFQSSSQPCAKQRRTLVFDDVDIPISSDDTLNTDAKTSKSNNYFDFNSTQDVISQNNKNNAKFRYSQADDVMLDNTSFLTRAKLSDDTVCRSTSRREVTQLNDVMDLFDESLRDAASKLDKGLLSSCVKTKKSCNKENDTLSSMFQNAKPIFTQAITNIKECNNFIDAYDIMDISNEVDSPNFKKDGNNYESCYQRPRQTIHLNQNIEPCDANINNNINNRNPTEMLVIQSDRILQVSNCANTEMEIDDQYANDIENPQQNSDEKITSRSHNNDIEKIEQTNKVESSRRTFEDPIKKESIHKAENIEVENANAATFKSQPSRKTLHFNNEFCELNESIAQKQLVKELTNTVENIEVENANAATYKSEPSRKTLHFNNEFCELDESIAQQPLGKELTNTVDNVTNDANNVYLETSNTDKSRNINSKKINNIVQKCSRQTIYLNNDIEESFISEAKTNINEEKSMKSTDGGFQNIQLDVDSNPKHTDIISNKRLTLYPNDDIRDEITDQEKATVTQNNLNLYEEIKKPRRNTIYFDNDNIIDENQATDKEREKFEIVKNGLSVMYNQEIDLDETLEKTAFVFTQKQENIETDNSKSLRKTLYFNKEIPLEIDTIRTKNNMEEENPDTGILNSNTLRKTQYFNNEITTEIPIQSNEVDRVVTGIFNSKPLRKTTIFNSEITTKEEPIKKQKHVGSEESVGKNPLYFDNKIPAKNGVIQNIETEKPAAITGESNAIRKTMHFDNEVCEIESSKSQKTDKQLRYQESQSRKSIYIAQDMDVTLNEVTSKFEDKSNFPCLKSDELMDVTLVSKDRNNDNEGKPQVITRRKSIYTAEYMDLTFDGDEQEKNEIISEPQVPNADSHMMNLILDVEQQIENTPEFEEEDNRNIFKECDELCLSKNEEPTNEKRKTLYFDDNNELSIDQSFTPAENYKFPEVGQPFNAAKMAMARHTKTNTVTSKLKLTNTQESAPMTPLNIMGSDANHRLFCMTPRLSLLEFTAAEKKAKEEERLQNAKYISPLRNGATNKRLPVNLTPVLSIPKKRQTLVFDDCLMDESCTTDQAEKIIEQLISPKVLDYDMEVTMEQNPYRLSRPGTYDKAIELSGIVSNESVLHTPPPNQRKSCIPIPISSGKKSNKSLLKKSSDNHREEDDLLDMEGDNLAESIQFMRRATTFTQRRDTTIGPTDLNIENESDRKPSIFEGNPITISDVTVFFEAQRKSNSLVPETENNLDVEELDVSGLKAIERAKKSLENHHLNLSLDDIEQTRLSLVRISYEEQEDNFAEDTCPPNNDIANGDVENNIDWKNKRQSVNYLRNVSAVCRKCKRCQETVLNETTSSTYDSFVLPPLPPLPDLGLDRLRRLRKRPIISDVNIMWHRVSLDRTIINPFNISDDESQIISDLDDETEDETSAVTKCIRKYKNEILSLENEVLGKQEKKSASEELPFVLRLDALLSASSTNWIFDFQMQSRGILFFTHKQLFTFAVSLKFDEVDLFGKDICVKCVKLEKGLVLEKNWKAIDFVLDFQLKLNLPFDLHSLCEGSNEADVFKMLQAIDRVCLDTIKMGNRLQRITFSNHASIIRDELRTYIRKIIRKIVKRTDSDFRYVEKTEIKVELLNLKKLSFKNIISPSLHNFRQEIHLLSTGLQFLEEFLPNPLNYINQH